MGSQNNFGSVNAIYLGRQQDPDSELFMSDKGRRWYDNRKSQDYYLIPMKLGETEVYAMICTFSEHFIPVGKGSIVEEKRMEVMEVYEAGKDIFPEGKSSTDLAKMLWREDPNDDEFFDSLKSPIGEVGDEIELDLTNSTIRTFDPKLIGEKRSDQLEIGAISFLIDSKEKELIEERTQSFKETFPNAAEEFESILNSMLDTIEDDEQKNRMEARARRLHKRVMNCVLAGKYNARDYRYFLQHLPNVIEGKEIFISEKDTTTFVKFDPEERIDPFKRPTRFDEANAISAKHGDINTRITDIPCVISKFGHYAESKSNRGLDTVEENIKELTPKQIEYLTKKGFSNEEIERMTVVYTNALQKKYGYRNEYTLHTYLILNDDGSYSSVLYELDTRDLTEIGEKERESQQKEEETKMKTI